LAEIPLDKRVQFAKVFFTGKADHCLRSSKINTDHLSCSEFAILISNRFAAEPTFELFDTFRHLEQTGAVTSYIDSFEELMGELAMKDPAPTEAYFIANFISGLKDYIKVHLKSHNPATLVQAYSLARNYESSRQKKALPDSGRWPSKAYQSRSLPTAGKKDSKEDKSTVTTRWEKGRCFKCQEPWVPGHNKVCKFQNQIQLIAIEDEDSLLQESTEATEPIEDQAGEPELQISMHALSETCSKAQTFLLFVQMDDVKLVALVDSGSTTSFLDPSIISMVGLILGPIKPEKVTVANGGTLWTQGIIIATPYMIQGHKFVIDFRVLELSGYAIILGCDWIYDYSPMCINFKTKEFTIEKDGKRVCFQDETLPNKNFLVSHKKMHKLLNKGVVGAVIYVQK
jgi:hypothetical protein